MLFISGKTALSAASQVLCFGSMPLDFCRILRMRESYTFPPVGLSLGDSLLSSSSTRGIESPAITIGYVIEVAGLHSGVYHPKNKTGFSRNCSVHTIFHTSVVLSASYIWPEAH